LLFLTPDSPAKWIEVNDVAAPVAFNNGDGSPAAMTRKLVLADRWVRVAVPPGQVDRRRKKNWFDVACAQAMLTEAAYTLWEAT
jgi:hypothetical protein